MVGARVGSTLGAVHTIDWPHDDPDNKRDADTGTEPGK